MATTKSTAKTSRSIPEKILTQYAPAITDLVHAEVQKEIRKLKKSGGLTRVTPGGTKIIPLGKKAGLQNRQRNDRQVSANQQKYHNHKAWLPYHHFLAALKDYGKPGTTREIGEHMLRMKPTNKELRGIRIDAKREFQKWGAEAFFQLMYNSSSYLAERNEIERKEVGPRKFAYFLKEWGKNGGGKKGSKKTPKTGNRTSKKQPSQLKKTGKKKHKVRSHKVAA